MTQKQKIATVFGGTGFVGRQVVRELAQRGITVKIATRIPEHAYFLKPCGNVGQIVPIACHYADEKSIAAAVKDADIVINCIGILFQKGRKQRFSKIHTELPATIAAAAKKAGAKRLIQISALSCDKGTSRYAKTKLAGEEAVFKAFKTATILRPSVIFGEDDSFFNMFAGLAIVFPALPLIGGGKTRFQPVFVGDVADAVMAALDKPETQGQIYELGGPEIVNFREIYELIFKYTGRKKALISLPFFWAKIEAGLLSLMPKPLLTPDQVESLKTDTVVAKDALTLSDLGVNPTTMEMILPRYLERYRAGGKFSEKKYA